MSDRRRRLALAALWPPILILGAYALLTLGVINVHLYMVAITAMVFFILGRFCMTLEMSKQERRQAIVHMEGFIAYMDDVLERDELDDEQRHSAEATLATAMLALDHFERSASRWTRRRERRAREKQAS